VICIGYLAEQIIQYFNDGQKSGINIRYSVEKEQLGTGGALKIHLNFSMMNLYY
jgi:NDP-sugar pyrophosphorylase family protein